MSSPPEAILAKLRKILLEKFRSLRIELCWKASIATGRIPFLHIWKPMQMPNLRFMTYLPSFHVIVTVGTHPTGNATNQIISMQLLTYQGRVIAKDSVNWKWIKTPHFKLISQLANDSIGKINILCSLINYSSKTLNLLDVRYL